MLTELVMLLAVASSCDVSRAALGLCQIECPTSGPGAFTVCASQTQAPGNQVASGGTQSPKPQRLCRYYVNGTIDLPTVGIITAWIDVGSRLCIGDEIPEPAPAQASKSVKAQLEEQFTAISKNPFAWWEPGSEVEIEEPAMFHVLANTTIESGQLFDQSAQIRFRPVGYFWDFSDGGSGHGQSLERSFAQTGVYRASAAVEYEVDYKIGGGSWIQNAASWSLSSNELSIVVIDPPRRTLLVG